MSEVLDLLQEHGEAFTQFKTHNDARLEELRSDLDSLSRRGASMPMGGENSISTAIKSFLQTGDSSQLAQKAGSTTVNADGGYTVVPELDNRLFDTLSETNPIFADVDRVTVDSNRYQRVYTATGAASGRVAETAARSETDSPVYARPEIGLTMQYALPSVTEELVLSSSFDIAGHIVREIATAFDADFEAEMIGGDGIAPNQKGILTAADSYDLDGARAFGSYQLVKSGVAGDFDYDNLVTLLHSLPVRYRRNAKLYASTGAIELMRKLKDSTSMPLWRDADSTVTRPQGILGVEVVEVPALPTVAVGSKSVMFGDLSQAYCFASHSSGMQILRDPYTTPGYIKFYSRLLCGSGAMDTRALKVMELAV